MGLVQPRSELKNHMILAKTISSCCTSTRRATSSIAIYWWATRFAQNVPPIRISSSLRASYKIWQVVFLSFLFSFDLARFASFLFLSLFTFAHSLLFNANTRYMIYELAHNFCSETTRCKCAKPKQSSRASLNRTW